VHASGSIVEINEKSTYADQRVVYQDYVAFPVHPHDDGGRRAGPPQGVVLLCRRRECSSQARALVSSLVNASAQCGRGVQQSYAWSDMKSITIPMTKNVEELCSVFMALLNRLW
jgi:hypothetical protein